MPRRKTARVRKGKTRAYKQLELRVNSPRIFGFGHCTIWSSFPKRFPFRKSAFRRALLIRVTICTPRLVSAFFQASRRSWLAAGNRNCGRR